MLETNQMTTVAGNLLLLGVMLFTSLVLLLSKTQCESTKDALRLVIDDDDDVFEDEFFSGPTLADCLAMAVLQEMPNLSTFQQFDEDASRAASSFQPPSVLLAKFTAEERQPGWCSTRRPMWQTFGIMTVVLLAMILGTISVAYLWK